MGSKEQAELVDKVQKLVVKKYGSATVESMRKLFDEYDRDKDQKISPDELETLLKDADVGNGFTRGAWVKGVIGALDTNADKKIDWDEFTAAIKSTP
ncbi:MAG TPA: EF-hand domain-containing protein [Polyangiaceae bacterium]|jgi:Ca2+-binding EF-hand superfamily protein